MKIQKKATSIILADLIKNGRQVGFLNTKLLFYSFYWLLLTRKALILASPTTVNLWVETDVSHLRKHCGVVRSSSVCNLIKLNSLLFSFCLWYKLSTLQMVSSRKMNKTIRGKARKVLKHENRLFAIDGVVDRKINRTKA